MKINDSHTCTQDLIGGGQVQILIIKLGPLRCLMSIGMEHSGKCSHRRSAKSFNDNILDHCLILYIEMELLQVGGPLMMEVVLQFLVLLQSA